MTHRNARPHPLILLVLAVVSAGCLAAGLTPPPVAASTDLTNPPAPRSPAPQSPATPLTITIASDEEVNEQLLWYDANGRPRHQFDVRLTDHDARTDRWTGSLTLTPTGDRRDTHRAVFMSGGEVAQCTITSGSRTVATDDAEGPAAMAVCEW
ncbi:hypothetical protein QNM97_15245 [Gordonia sp. L191]|uniref:hypothetical protein n=1 Tax=Gordonia sp. L191 TaxID=2982699 RepID=UPI0024BFBDF2|nr:hypothetical protein [Gordonia sp. L191]WHU45382.1 hypothetical protein QNM97_15245 [Gordonia sp. L191]